MAVLKRLVEVTCKKSNASITSEFFARNCFAIKKLKDEFNVNFSRFSDLTLKLLKRKSDDVVRDYASKDELASEVFQSIEKFKKDAMFWSNYSEKDYLTARSL